MCATDSGKHLPKIWSSNCSCHGVARQFLGPHDMSSIS